MSLKNCKAIRARKLTIFTQSMDISVLVPVHPLTFPQKKGRSELQKIMKNCPTVP